MMRDPDTAREAFEERAAIMEFDGGLSRDDAERAARESMTSRVDADATAITSRRWLLHYPDRDPVDVACYPAATQVEILRWNPDAVAAEPFTPTIRRPSTPLTARDAAAIRTWLAYIGETDQAIIAEVMDRCRRDADARDYFMGRANEAR